MPDVVVLLLLLPLLLLSETVSLSVTILLSLVTFDEVSLPVHEFNNKGVHIITSASRTVKNFFI